MINEIYEKFKDVIYLSLEDLMLIDLKITYNDNYLLIESDSSESDSTLYCYYNIKGFTPFNFKFYKTIYLLKSEYERIHFDKNSKYLYSKTLIIKNGVEFYKLDYMPRLRCQNKHEFDLLLDEISVTKQKRKLLLHSCCGPCSSYCLEYLNKYFDITIFYSNSNIDSLDEFNKRVETQKEIIEKMNLNVEIVVDTYNESDYIKAIKGLESLGEFSPRCYNCYKFRLERTFDYAIKHGFDFASTTLSISPYKNSNWINEIGLELEKKTNLSFLYSNFKLNNGYKKSIELSKKYNLYRQDYCGCIYSKNGK